VLEEVELVGSAVVSGKGVDENGLNENAEDREKCFYCVRDGWVSFARVCSCMGGVWSYHMVSQVQACLCRF